MVVNVVKQLFHFALSLGISGKFNSYLPLQTIVPCMNFNYKVNFSISFCYIFEH